jgi:hypothetical protein
LNNRFRHVSNEFSPQSDRPAQAISRSCQFQCLGNMASYKRRELGELDARGREAGCNPTQMRRAAGLRDGVLVCRPDVPVMGDSGPPTAILDLGDCGPPAPRLCYRTVGWCRQPTASR